MEIRTLDEVRAGRVRVTVDVELSGRRYTDEDVARLQASEAELVAAPLRRRVEELEAALTEIDKEADRLRGVVIEYDLDRHTERERADRAEAELERRTSERDEREAARRRLEEGSNRALNERNTARRKLEAVRSVLLTPSVTAALARLEDSEADYVHSLAWAVKNALGTLDAA
jgi:chromosome segregation ATPase